MATQANGGGGNGTPAPGANVFGRISGKRRRRRKEDFQTPLESLHNLMAALTVEDAGRCAQGLLRGTSVWIRVKEATSFCLGLCCIGRFIPSGDAVLDDAMAAIGSPRPSGEGAPADAGEPEASGPADGASLSWFRLSLEEAFFLLHCLKCLEIRDVRGGSGSPGAPGAPLSLEACWRAFVGLQPNFLRTYVSYQHYRAEGYIVKSGIYYGCTHVLYGSHPTVNHSEYCVLAILQKDGRGCGRGNGGSGNGSDRGGEEDGGFLAHEDLQSLVRVSVNVKKKLVLLYIFFPTAEDQERDHRKRAKVGEESLGSPRVFDVSDVEILQRVEVDEFVVSRWLPGNAPTG